MNSALDFGTNSRWLQILYIWTNESENWQGNGWFFFNFGQLWIYIYDNSWDIETLPYTLIIRCGWYNIAWCKAFSVAPHVWMYYPNIAYPLSLPLSNVYSTQGLLYRWTEHSIVATKLFLTPNIMKKYMYYNFFDKSSSLKLSGLVSSTQWADFKLWIGQCSVRR